MTPFSGVVITGTVELQRPRFAAAREPISVGKIRHAVSEIDFRVEKAARGTVIAHAARGHICDLHETIITPRACRSVIAAFLRDQPMQQMFEV